MERRGEVDFNPGFLETISSHPPTLESSLKSIIPISFLLAEVFGRLDSNANLKEDRNG